MKTEDVPLVAEANPAVIALPLPGKPRTLRRKKAVPPRREPVVIDEELFRSVLTKEAKRAYRSNRSMVLLVVATRDRASAQSASVWAPVIEAVAAVARDTDVLGWFEWRNALGLILPDITTCDTSRAREIEARVQREMAKRSGAETSGRFSVRLHVHPTPQCLEDTDPTRTAVPLAGLPPRDVKGSVYAALKRGLDITGSVTLLATLAPLMVLIAAVVKAKSRGPVLYEQVRVGQGMQPFKMLKFRTMHANADHAIHREYVTSFIQSSAAANEGASGAPVFKIANDPRVTPIGRFLRKTSLDELPQLWNVLRGDMSLVGPRPPLPYEVQQYQSWHVQRVVDAKPGITGLWQVTGRSRTNFDQMVRLDLRYARNCSLWTDIKILLATPAAVISGKGAC
jgi:lipopolysaccharide/colanic/teichoic acid biosynthesis glycosyltransferase